MVDPLENLMVDSLLLSTLPFQTSLKMHIAQSHYHHVHPKLLMFPVQELTVINIIFINIMNIIIIIVIILR